MDWLGNAKKPGIFSFPELCPIIPRPKRNKGEEGQPIHRFQESLIGTQLRITNRELTGLKMRIQQKKCIAVICASAVWFSFLVNHSLVAAPARPRVVLGDDIPSAVPASVDIASEPAAGTSGEDTDSGLGEAFVLPDVAWGTVATLFATAGAALLFYNLVTARKHGWGWMVLSATGVVIAYFGKLGASLFCEISADATGISDWDSD